MNTAAQERESSSRPCTSKGDVNLKLLVRRAENEVDVSLGN